MWARVNGAISSYDFWPNSLGSTPCSLSQLRNPVRASSEPPSSRQLVAISVRRSMGFEVTTLSSFSGARRSSSSSARGSSAGLESKESTGRRRSSGWSGRSVSERMDFRGPRMEKPPDLGASLSRAICFPSRNSAASDSSCTRRNFRG